MTNRTDDTAGSTAGAFTPGPWQSKYGDYAPTTELVQIIGNVDANWHGDGLCYTDVCEISESPDEVGNLRLICAAPDLYAALKTIVALDGGEWHPERHAREKEEAYQRARSAIAKAEGR